MDQLIANRNQCNYAWSNMHGQTCSIYCDFVQAVLLKRLMKQCFE